MNAEGSEAWSALEKIFSFVTELFRILSQLALIFHLSRATGGPLFAILCIVKPLVSASTYEALWTKRTSNDTPFLLPSTATHDISRIACFLYVNNEPYKRMKKLEALSGDTYRQDTIGNNLGGWIVKGLYLFASFGVFRPLLSSIEYTKAFNALGNVSDGNPYLLFGKKASPWFEIFSKALGELPMVCPFILHERPGC